jgi:hypothetical protein
MSLEALPRSLVWTGAAHALLALVAGGLLLLPAQPIMGVHPALKPMKFGVSIALFLWTMAYVLPMLSVRSSMMHALAWTLCFTMVLEMVPIVLQPLRGTTSHFNTYGAFNQALWLLMMAAIVVATMAMTAVAVLATVKPLRLPDGTPMHPLVAAAWRAGLWILLASAASGARMGGRQSHGVGAGDGGPGVPLLNWSTSHGDLRVSHFFSLHALQTVPLLGWLIAALPLPAVVQWLLLGAVVLLHVLLVGGTFLQALAGRPCC